MADFLFESTGNPIPEHAESGHFAGRGGTRLRYARFAATGRPLRGTVVVFPGRNEPIEKYFETVRDMQARGFTVAMFDWRGQGGSDRLTRNPMRGHIRSFDHHLQDIDRFVGEILLPDCRAPFYVLAHSTGALIALLAAPRLANRIRRMVLCAPLLTVGGLPVSMTFLRRATGILAALGLGRLFIRRKGRGRELPGFDTNNVTTDPARFARNQAIYREHPGLALGGPTIGWVHAACKASERVQRREFVRRLRIPMLVVAAGGDTVVATAAIEAYTRALPATSLITIDGARHELLQEAARYREQVLAAFDAFIPGGDDDGVDPFG